MTGFWAGRRVLITGHTGFKGAWLIKWLDMLGAHTMGYALPSDTTGVFDKMRFSNLEKNVYANVCDRALLIKTVRQFEPEVVFHLAAQAIVGIARENPVQTFETNLMGTVNLLEAIKITKSVRAVVVVTSDKVYENFETTEPYKENARFGGDEPYAASKACAELAVCAYRNVILSSEIGIATARAANVYGGGDLHFDRLIPYLIQSKLNGTVANIRNPDSVRPWQHVLSPLYGYLLLAQSVFAQPDAFSEGFNFGPPANEMITVSQLSAMITGYAEAKDPISVRNEAGLLLIDSAKSQKRLGWRPVFSMHQGLMDTTEFYRSLFQGEDVNVLMENCIAAAGVNLS